MSGSDLQGSKRNYRASEKKKLKEGRSFETLLGAHKQCCFLLLKKQRLCNMERVGGWLYCGNHRQDALKDVYLQNPVVAAAEDCLSSMQVSYTS